MGSLDLTENRVRVGESPSLTDITAAASYKELHTEVSKITKSSSWYEMHGVDNLIIWSFMLLLFPAFYLLSSASWSPFLVGMFLLGLVHGTITTKAAHLAAHGSLSRNRLLNRFLRSFFVEFLGSFTVEKGLEIHITIHHPHTNVIGLGDSSSWRAPFLNRFTYMFVAPLFLPLITPLVGMASLWGRPRSLLWYTCVMGLGLASYASVLTLYCGLGVSGSLLTMFVSRSLLSIPYIHVNIFQHIGLHMFSQQERPPRLHLMTHGCLNLPPNTLLDYCFGHSLISCHVEHHLFPHLSDNMCQRIKPVVRKYVKDKQLPYQEDSYWNRLVLFVRKYEELMVDPPPITSFVGVQ